MKLDLEPGDVVEHDAEHEADMKSAAARLFGGPLPAGADADKAEYEPGEIEPGDGDAPLSPDELAYTDAELDELTGSFTEADVAAALENATPAKRAMLTARQVKTDDGEDS